MIAHLERRYGFERPAAYALCSACADLRISEVVDVPYVRKTVIVVLDCDDAVVGFGLFKLLDGLSGRMHFLADFALAKSKSLAYRCDPSA